MHSGIFRARQLVVLLFFLVSLSVLAARLFYIQVIRYPFYSQIANEQHVVSTEIQPRRGAIYDRNMRVLAINLNTDSIFANPRVITDRRKAARLLAPVLSMDEDYIAQRLFRDKGFVWLKRKASPKEGAAVRRLKIEGISVIPESKRVYPNRSMACHVIGTVDIDNNGLEGLELYYNKYLRGEEGWLISTRDAKRKILESYQDEYIPPKNGLNLVLTIDEVIQHIAERELQKMYEKYHAKAAMIMVMDPRTGDVLALANFPNYDLGDLNTRQPEAVRNRAINDFFEPGSVFKVITASAALEEKVVTFEDTFDCEYGEWHIGSRILHDHKPHGILTFKEVIELSSNIGTVKVASRFGAQTMYRYIKAFGFYDRTGIDLPGEVVGMNRSPEKWSKVSMFAIPMGQEVTATVAQLACAISVIANDGYLVKPRVVREIVDDEGRVVKEFPPRIGKERVISADTVMKMRSILMGVVQEGTGKKAKVEEYTTGGKTGTAQKLEPNGTYSHNKYVGSFIGFAPVENPALAVVVCIDESKVVYFGGDVAAPVFRNVVDGSLKYLHAKGSIPACAGLQDAAVGASQQRSGAYALCSSRPS